VAHKLAPGEEKSIPWRNEGNTHEAEGWLMVLKKVTFDEGTSVEIQNPGPGCYGEWWFNKKHPKLEKLPSLARN
jgi:hypothetical protein